MLNLYRCPHCFHHFKEKDSLFRCQSIPQICSGVEDKIYNETHREGPSLQGRILERDSSKSFGLWSFLSPPKRSISCSQCANLTPQTVCPKCHHNLPVSFFDSQSVALGFICQRSQEMDAFLSYLRKALEKGIAHDLGYILCPGNSETKNDIILQRIVVRKFLLKKTKSSFLNVHFYPLNTEELSNARKLDGIFLFCDKLNAEEGRSYVPDAIHKLVQRWTESLARRAPQSSQKFPVSLGIIYNCFENLEPLLPKTHPLFHQGEHNEGYNERDGARISSEMLAYTGCWFGANLLQILRANFQIYRLFCQSFVYPETQPFMPHAGWRVEDPFLWMLKTLGYLKAKSS